MSYLPLPENAVRQSIDSGIVYDEYCRAEIKALPYAGGMFGRFGQSLPEFGAGRDDDRACTLPRRRAVRSSLAGWVER